ncbi:hypothetical protein NUU61_005196 [Penicillium alfredii]|uniref:Integral membrane protein n=1 Tax=Penicillium alfredii TaxID=1506179 RepID=A0A9W9F8X6_9EURO|nr:uncharacterized protein NUU61_005196 [Penicillium alfredii]KAJ5095840.1 hypothetical protein NUU61_005196 [Penicillium alfredii]
MGKAGRVACIFTPYVFTIAALICIIMVGLGCTNSTSNTLNDLYFLRVNIQNMSSGSATTQKIDQILSENHITNVDTQDVQDFLKQLQNGNSELKDFYSIGLWGYCDGEINNGKTDTTWCSKPTKAFAFDPIKVWKLNDSQVKNELPEDYTKLMNAYRAVAKWMFAAYVVAFVATLVELLVGIFAIFSRWGSCVTTLVSLVAFFFTAAASVTATVLYSVMEGSGTAALKAYGIKLDMGKNMYAATWLATVFALGGALFWTFSVCCCSGRSPYGHRERHNRGSVTAEKAPYTYEPLGPTGQGQVPYGHQHTTSYPPPPVHGHDIPGTNQRSNAYEPFRHV